MTTNRVIRQIRGELFFIHLLFTTTIFLSSCTEGCSHKANGEEYSKETTSTSAPLFSSPFNADSAYAMVQKQVDFGPRVPNSKGHQECGDFLARYLEANGLKVLSQYVDFTAYDGTILKGRNIIASYEPERTERILLCAHWDTRPVADHDANPSRRSAPIDGADDGGSGTGVLLEIARVLQEEPLSRIGVDIVLFDAEDYGVPHDVEYSGDSNQTWALGSQHWSTNPHVKGYKALFGILLDMVGSQGAKFYREYYSQEYAPRETSLIWSTAHRLGFQEFFINKPGGGITDDHLPVIRNLGIPCVDIINYDPNSENGFGHYWHTHKDNMEVISRETLRAVGTTVWQVLLDIDKQE